MTNKLPERALDSELAMVPDESFPDSESVSQYLSDHPDFFDQYPELLNAMHVPHIDRGSAISLVERQVHNLRSNNKELNQQLQELLDIARGNDRLADRLHCFTLTLLECRSLEEVLSVIKVELVESFEIDQVVMRFDLTNHLNDPLNSSYNELAASETTSGATRNITTRALLDKLFVTNAVPVCFNHADKGCFQELFDLQSQTISSSVVLPLSANLVTGLLALGSTDGQRFRPGMSTTYLTRLTDLINRILACHIK